MMLLGIVLGCSLAGVYAISFTTPTPVLDKRQISNAGIATVWRRSIDANVVTYIPAGYSGSQTVVVYDTAFDWCSIGGPCSVATACHSGTVYYEGGNTATCGNLVCGLEYLYATPGATQALFTHDTCFSATGVTTNVNYLATDAAEYTGFSLVPATTGGASYSSAGGASYSSAGDASYSSAGATWVATVTVINGSGSTTPSDSSGGSSKPIGAIVGGVIGGLAILCLTAVAVLLIMRRRQNPTALVPEGSTKEKLAMTDDDKIVHQPKSAPVPPTKSLLSSKAQDVQVPSNTDGYLIPVETPKASPPIAHGNGPSQDVTELDSSAPTYLPTAGETDGRGMTLSVELPTPNPAQELSSSITPHTVELPTPNPAQELPSSITPHTVE